MNKELTVYTPFSQVMVHQKIAVFFPSKLVPDLLDHYVIVYLAGKIWSSICIQDIVKPELHYQINLIRLINIITRFLYQIFLT